MPDPVHFVETHYNAQRENVFSLENIWKFLHFSHPSDTLLNDSIGFIVLQEEGRWKRNTGHHPTTSLGVKKHAEQTA